jgi:hypothetical protein
MVQRTGLFLLAILAVPILSAAQVIGPVSTSSTLLWTAPANVTSSAEAVALEYRFRDNGGAFLVVPSVTCSSVAPFTCSAKLPSPIVSILNVIGSHAITLSAFAGGSVGLEGGQSLPFTLTSPPGVVTGLSLTK